MDLNHDTGAVIQGWPHVVQCIQTILGTRLNTRVFRREFGSDVPAMVDAPMNDANVLSLYVAVAEALDAWEPRFELTDVQVETLPTGTITMVLQGNYLPNGHLGDLTIVSDGIQAIRLQADRADTWRLAA